VRSYEIFRFLFLFFPSMLVTDSIYASSDHKIISNKISVDSSSSGYPLIHYWSKVVGAGRANEGLRASWQEQLELVHKNANFRYVRMHGIFHDDMFVYREDEKGNPIYNFQYVDDLYDRILSKGMKPFVELGFSPSQMASVQATIFWWKANGSPPRDYHKWTALVEAFVRHCINRYGIDEVKNWYFEVWNEPNLSDPFFRGGNQKKYFELYRDTAISIKNINENIKVGGPATSNFYYKDGAWLPIWVSDFLKYAHTNNLPVDFVSVHPYPASYPNKKDGETTYREKNATIEDINKIYDTVKNSDYPQAEIHLTEWSGTPKIHDYQHDSLASASYILRSVIGGYGKVDSLSYWVFTDIFEEFRNRDSAFHGGFGLVNFQGIIKPSFHAYRFLNYLGDTVLFKNDNAIISKDKEIGDISILSWNYPDDVNTVVPNFNNIDKMKSFELSGKNMNFSIDINNLPPNEKYCVEILDYDHGYALPQWVKMGAPPSPTREQTKYLQNYAWGTKKMTIYTNNRGELKYSEQLHPWSILSIHK
jgi:xylan 1,4-beta-xylosidase